MVVVGVVNYVVLDDWLFEEVWVFVWCVVKGLMCVYVVYKVLLWMWVAGGVVVVD